MQVPILPDVPDNCSSLSDTSSCLTISTNSSPAENPSTLKLLFIAGWVIGFGFSMFALLLSFVQTILYRSLSRDEANTLRKEHSTTRPYHFFLISMVVGNCLMVYPYLWLVGRWRAILINVAIIAPSAAYMMYILTGNIATVNRLCPRPPGQPGPSSGPQGATPSHGPTGLDGVNHFVAP